MPFSSSDAREFELLTDHLPVMVAHCDRDFRFKYVNKAYAARFGLTVEQFRGRQASEIIGADAVRVLQPYVDRALAGETLEYETWVPYQTIGRRYMRCVYKPEFDKSGHVVGFVAGLFDETARKTAEDALRASSDRLDFVAASVDIGVWSCDLPFDELIWNAACKKHFGLPPDARVTIETFYERMHPDDVVPTRDAIRKAIDEGQPYDVEYRTRQRDDSFRWIRAVGRAEYDESGNPRRFEGVTVDVTAAKHAQDRFRELADAMPQILWSADANGRTDYLNRRWYELTGKPEGDLSTDGVVDPADAEGARAAFRRSIQTGEPYQHEYRLHLRGYAEPRWHLGRALPVRDDAGRIVRWYATSTDIHDQKHTQAALADSRDRLRAALDASNTGTFRWDIDANTLDWDDNLDRLFGLTPGESVRTLTEFVKMVHPEDRQRVIDACARSAAEGADFVEEYRVIRRDGTIRWLYDQGRVHLRPDGGRFMIGACLDVTARRLHEEALREADRQKDEFLGMLAHELRNPLAPMIYAVSMLERTVREPGARRPIDIIGRQAARMVRIVDDLLDVSRVTQGKIALQRELVSIGAVLTQCLDSVRMGFGARRHSVVFVEDTPGYAVIGDPVRLAQIFENLLVNAAKYTPDGGRIEVRLTGTEDRIRVAVSDNGIGIAPEMLGRVFDLFVQADTSLDRAEGGLGIGLTLVDKLTRMHGGQVWVHSEGPGRGSSFVVELPRAKAVTASIEPVAAVDSTQRRILVVDDNVDSADMLKALLEAWGHAAHAVYDGTSALRDATEFRPDVILLDIGLPGKDGYQVAAEIRAEPALAAATLIAATGYGRPEDRARCLASGFDDHVTKPVDPDVLRRLIASERTL